MLHSEKIISAKEIIGLGSGDGTIREDTIFLGDAILPDDISGSGIAGEVGSILVMTFFLRDEEILRSFTALESGILYLALCPQENSSGNY